MLGSLLIQTACSLPEWERAATVLFLRANECPEIFSESKRREIYCQQTFFPEFDALKRKGCKTITEASGKFPFVLYLGTKFKNENISMFSRALSHLEPGGTFLAALPNTLGANRFEKILFEAADEERFSLGKSKARVFGFRSYSGKAASLPPVEHSAGVFSKTKVDEGSALLADAISGKLTGVGADLGAGEGFLSDAALRGNESAAAVTLFESELTALHSAHEKLASFGERCKFEWSDVTRGIGREVFDWVISNPPFHRGAGAEVSLGLRFIDSAMNGLRPGGIAFFVQNRNLPYIPRARERGVVSMLSETERYIVWQCVKQS